MTRLQIFLNKCLRNISHNEENFSSNEHGHLDSLIEMEMDRSLKVITKNRTRMPPKGLKSLKKKTIKSKIGELFSNVSKRSKSRHQVMS